MGALLEGEPGKYMAWGDPAPKGSHVMRTRWQKEGRRHKTHPELQGKRVEPPQPLGSKESLESRRGTLLGSLSVIVIPTCNKNCKRTVKLCTCLCKIKCKKSQCKNLWHYIHSYSCSSACNLIYIYINELLSLNSVFSVCWRNWTLHRGKNFRPITYNFIQTHSENYFRYLWVKGAK